MKKIKIIMILLAIMIILITITLLLINQKEDFSEESQNDSGMIENLPQEDINKEQERINLLKVKSSINSYISIVNKNNTSYFTTDENGNNIRIISEQEIRKSIYELLSQVYISKNNITEDNVYEFVDDINENLIFNVLDIRYYKNDNSDQYVVYGFYQNLQNEFIKYAYYIVNIDEAENIFSIEPVEGDNLEIEKIAVEDTNITKNDNNIIPAVNTDNESICNEYLLDYKRLMLSRPQEAYNILNEEYKQKKYGSLENFEEYINSNREIIQGVRLDKYSISVKEKETEYVCIDQYGNYYIFTENGVMDYTVILDTYTINLPQFLEKYENGNEQVKVGMNIEKFISSINMKDYKYAYSCLADSFKANSYQTQESFEEYVKSNFFEKNKIEYESFSKEGENYIYEIKISDEQGISQDVKNVTIIMQLKEGTDFVMSFSIN